ncbi:unnamed protein product [Hermetia illucens]|uniref:F-box domain-containing protein n=1 Tax=Hermetia illucens TaxID=343691 RepID=A0A7R8UXK0_HERIL|nr:F-box only protein 42 [Hermetia illucens]CAD7088361.1 unnamed protein product [Hermetia illucens]
MVDINALPDEVLEFILSYLPPYRDLEKCEIVCKRWRAIVRNVRRRAKMNLNRGLVDFHLCWRSLHPVDMVPMIAGRFSHSAVVHENSMYIFGGGSSADTTFNDLWRFDLSERKWVRPLSMGNYPSPKASATMVCYGDQLILFGGWRYPSLYPPYQPWRLFDELHMYSIKDNRWTVHTPACGPPPMAGHSATIQGNKMVVFGGYQLNNEVNSNSNDIWCLNLDTLVWYQPEVAGVKPPARYAQFQIVLDDDHILVIGGCGGPNNMFSDAWLLNMKNEVWQWRNVPIKNRKWAATHMWCNPACRVGSKLVVLGPTPSRPLDFQILKQQMPQVSNRVRHEAPLLRDDNAPWNRNRVQNEDGLRNPRQELNVNARDAPNRQAGNGNDLVNRHNNLVNNNQRNANVPNDNQNNANIEDEAINRLQRNLALRYRESDPKMPKRFDERHEDRFRMAAFNVPDNAQNASSRERQQERVRRMEEKMNALRNLRRNNGEQKTEEPTRKRAKRNCLAMFVCDISNVLSGDCCIEWIEYKNYGIVAGAPERLILSSIVAGNGELIMFGGVNKESLTEMVPQVSNAVHFLTAPRTII